MQAAINAAATYLPTDLPNPPVYSKTNPADTPILTLALTSKELPLDQVEDLADTRLAEKISQLPGVGLVSIGGGQKPSVRIQANPTSLASYGMTLEDLRTAIASANVNEAKGQLRRQAAGVHDRRQRSVAHGQGLPAADRRVSQRRAGQTFRRRQRDRRRRERQGGGVDEPDAGRDRQRAAPARRQHHRGRGPDQGADAAPAGLAARVGESADSHRSHHHDSRVGAGRASSS